MIDFAWPYVFLLLPLPWVVYQFFPPGRLHESAPLRVPELNDFSPFQHTLSASSLKPKYIFAFLIWLLLLTAAARPQWAGEIVEIPQSGRDLMIAVDLSGSMQIQDFELKGKYIDRLTALKAVASDFIERRKGDRIGLILFGTHAYLQTPLTFDIATVKQLLREAAVGLAGNETAIGDAIGLAVKQLRDSPQASRVLVLLTDGINNAGELTPEKAAEIAAHENLKIHTVAIGAKEIPVQTIFGIRHMQPSGEIDEKALKMVAEKTGGKYFRAYNTNELAQIYQEIDRLEYSERGNQYYRPTDEIYYWPLLFALIGFALWLCYEIRWSR